MNFHKYNFKSIGVGCDHSSYIEYLSASTIQGYSYRVNYTTDQTHPAGLCWIPTYNATSNIITVKILKKYHGISVPSFNFYEVGTIFQTSTLCSKVPSSRITSWSEGDVNVYQFEYQGMAGKSVFLATQTNTVPAQDYLYIVSVGFGEGWKDANNYKRNTNITWTSQRSSETLRNRGISASGVVESETGKYILRWYGNPTSSEKQFRLIYKKPTIVDGVETNKIFFDNYDGNPDNWYFFATDNGDLTTGTQVIPVKNLNIKEEANQMVATFNLPYNCLYFGLGKKGGSTYAELSNNNPVISLYRGSMTEYLTASTISSIQVYHNGSGYNNYDYYTGMSSSASYKTHYYVNLTDKWHYLRITTTVNIDVFGFTGSAPSSASGANTCYKLTPISETTDGNNYIKVFNVPAEYNSISISQKNSSTSGTYPYTNLVSASQIVEIKTLNYWSNFRLWTYKTPEPQIPLSSIANLGIDVYTYYGSGAYHTEYYSWGTTTPLYYVNAETEERTIMASSSNNLSFFTCDISGNNISNISQIFPQIQTIDSIKYYTITIPANKYLCITILDHSGGSSGNQHFYYKGEQPLAISSNLFTGWQTT